MMNIHNMIDYISNATQTTYIHRVTNSCEYVWHHIIMYMYVEGNKVGSTTVSVVDRHVILRTIQFQITLEIKIAEHNR